MQTIYMNPRDPAAATLIGRTFPGVTVREVAVRISDGGMSLTSCWDGGRRDLHRVVRLADMQVFGVPENGSGYTQVDRTFGPAGLPLNLPAPGFAVVTLTEGGYKSLAINIHSENAAKLIPAPTELTWAERVVLVATRSLRNSYGGIKDYRFHEAQRDTGITRAEWDTAKAALIERKLLNAAGAITTEGRNAAGTKDLYCLKRQDSHAA